jgi:hypothetical protein
LVEFLKLHDAPSLLFETAWVLTNITADCYTRVVAESGAVELLAHLLFHGDPNVREQSVWCLGNIAGESTQYREGLLVMPEVVGGL